MQGVSFAYKKYNSVFIHIETHSTYSVLLKIFNGFIYFFSYSSVKNFSSSISHDNLHLETNWIAERLFCNNKDKLTTVNACSFYRNNLT
jgi:hypothetical protein